MYRHLQRALVAAACGAAILFAEGAHAIETTYGEDPVPNSKCYDGFINLGYGIDPIPAKSPYVRWQEWRASRGLAPTIGPFKRQVGESRYRTAPPVGGNVPQASTADESQYVAPAQPSPGSSRRNARTQNLSGRPGVR